MQAVWERVKLRRAIDGSGKGAEAFALDNQLEPVATRAAYDKAIHERAERRAARAKLVSDFEASGLSQADFVARQKMSLTRLQHAIQKLRALQGVEGA